MSNHACSGSHGTPLYSSVYQTLDELSFEKGIWGAALDGDVDKLRKLLKTVDPSTPDASGYTALHYAARNAKEEVCKLLLESGANPNAQTHGGATALHRASLHGHLGIVTLLLRSRADPALCDSDGKTALHKAAEGHRLAVAQILLEKKPELKAMKDKRDLLPIQCVKNGNVNLSTLLSL